MPRSENERYVEYLQEDLLRDWSSGDWCDPVKYKAWVLKNRAKLIRIAENGFPGFGARLAGDLERRVLNHESTTKYDLHATQDIFGPLLETIRRAASRLRLPPVRRIQLVTSTDPGPSACARPTTGNHLLFVGPGTFSFCNYWAKVFAALITAIARDDPKRRIESKSQLVRILEQEPAVLSLATGLCLNQAVLGHCHGFGGVTLSSSTTSYRCEVLQAMEIFVVAHEYAHFFAEEHIAEFREVRRPEISQRLESFCDKFGMALVKEATKETNYLAFLGVGALLIFRVMQACQRVETRLTEVNPRSRVETIKEAQTHPDFEIRISSVRECNDKGPDYLRFFDEYDRIATSLGEAVLESVDATLGLG